MLEFAIYIVFIGLTVCYWKEIYQRLYNRWRIIKALHPLPGPLALPIIGIGYLLKLSRKATAIQINKIGAYYSSQGYGIMKIWLGPFPKVLVIKAETAKVVLESNTLIKKGEEYNILIPWLGTGLLVSTGAKWQQRRKMLTPSFHFTILNDFISVFNDQTRVLLDQIDSFSETQEQFDLFPWVKRCALDIICETAMGHTVAAQVNHDHEYVLSVGKLAELVVNYNRKIFLQPKLIWWLTGNADEYEKNLKVVTNFTTKVIKQKMSLADDTLTSKRKKAFLDMLLDLYREGKLEYEDIREEVDTFMFAGHDTTSTSIGWTIWCLAHNPNWQKRVQKELDDIFGNSDRDITSEDLTNLKELERCIKEGLRLRPTVPYFLRDVDQDFEINGHIIPKGCSIVVCPYMIHIDKKQYENPEQYNPDRFLEENTSKRHPYAFIPFSAGPRNCIGQKFAMMEEKIILAWILRTYSISSSIPFEENHSLPEVISRPILGFPVKLEKRTYNHCQ